MVATALFANEAADGIKKFTSGLLLILVDTVPAATL